MASAVSNILAGGLPPGISAPQNAPNPSGPLGPAGPPPEQPSVLNSYDAPLAPETYELDPFALETPVKIRILGSSRMLARPILAQQFQFLAPLMLSGPFLEQLALQGEAIDMTEFFRLAQDATGLGKSYKFVKPMTPEQQQARSQPPPETAALLQKAQLDQQGRANAVASKERTEMARLQTDSALKDKQITEESSRHLLTLAHQEKQHQADSQGAQQQVMLDMLKGKQNLQQSAQQAALKQSQAEQAHQQKLMFQSQQQHQNLIEQARQHGLDMATQSHTHQHDLAMNQAQKRQDLAHQALMNLMARRQKEHEVEQARKQAALKPKSPAGPQV